MKKNKWMRDQERLNRAAKEFEELQRKEREQRKKLMRIQMVKDRDKKKEESDIDELDMKHMVRRANALLFL